jgi:hypothetical protein
LTLYKFRPVANGLRTDHPIPDLPFVDDSHIPLEDPAAIEAVGRHEGTDMWGREDSCREGGWVAFTTDPIRHDFGWCVRWHPDHGRSIVLYRDEDAASVHMAWWGPALLFRSGGYWWDGTTWYRPSQVWDAAGEEYVRRLVPAARTVTAADLLDADGDAARGRVLQIGDLDGNEAPRGRWLDDLALWADRRQERGRLSNCVVTLAAPELTGDQLVGVAEMAQIAGIAASTLRAYLSRDEADVPHPQAIINGRSVWARPVAEEWAEQRRRSPEGVSGAVSPDRAGPSPGQTEVWNWFTRMFFAHLWERPDRRRRWALRWRSEAAVRQLAEELGWDVAANIPRLVPPDALALTIKHAILDEFATGQDLHRKTRDGTDDSATFYGVTPAISQMLDWFIRHNPGIAGATIAEIVGEAEQRLGIPREVSGWSFRTALALDGKLDADTRNEFLDRVLPPARSSDS